jgi:hypothetical protein
MKGREYSVLPMSTLPQIDTTTRYTLYYIFGDKMYFLI